MQNSVEMYDVWRRFASEEVVIATLEICGVSQPILSFGILCTISNEKGKKYSGKRRINRDSFLKNTSESKKIIEENAGKSYFACSGQKHTDK